MRWMTPLPIPVRRSSSQDSQARMSGKAERAEGGATVFEVEEYLLLDGFVKLLEGATVGGACFCFRSGDGSLIR